jgi:ribosomal protein S18 acetylase RimI-like enzyme
MSQPETTWRLEPAGVERAGQLAGIHARALPDDFLPSLGPEFLKHLYYPAALSSPDGAHIVAITGEDPVGFVCVAHDADRFTGGVIRSRLFAVALYACRAILRRPSRLRMMCEIAWSIVTATPDGVPGEIVFIAVDPGHQGRGIGSALVGAATEYLATRRVNRCRTKTLATNHGVIRMYERLGWHVRNRFRVIGRDYVTIVSPSIQASH